MDLFLIVIASVILSVIVGYFGVVLEDGLKKLKDDCPKNE